MGGGVIFVVAFMGCCGAWKESKCLIYTYAFFLAVILIAQIGAGIAAYMLKGDLDAEVVKNMNAGMSNYGKGAEFEGVTHTWDIVQNELHCCGLRVPLTGPVKGMKLSLMVKFLTAAVLEGRSLIAAPTLTWRSSRMVAIVSSRPSSSTTLLLLEALLWVWLPLSWPSSSLLAALEKGWAIHHSMSDPWGSVHEGKMWKAL